MFEKLREKAHNTKVAAQAAVTLAMTSKTAGKLMIVTRYAMIALTCVMVVGLLLSGQIAFAGGIGTDGGTGTTNSDTAGENASTLFTLLFKIVGAMVLILGIIFGLLGIVHYVTANSEGDGPAKQKAMLQLASGIMLVALGIILMNGAIMAQFSQMVTGVVTDVGSSS